MSLPPDFATPVSGPAYSLAFRVMATIALLLVLWQGAFAIATLQEQGASSDAWLLFAAGIAVLLVTYVLLLRARTTIDAQGICQSGLLQRRVAWSDVQAVRLGGPSFARRLRVRIGFGQVRVFFGGADNVIEAFGRIAEVYAG